MRALSDALLTDDEPLPFSVERAQGASPYLLLCEHGGKRIPRKLGDLGLDGKDLSRHIAWDIGALAVARILSQRLDATLISQTYSRLVIDCNRKPSAHDAIPVISEETEIPGNRDLSAAEAAARIDEFHRPYQTFISDYLDKREAPIVVDIHSFTPVYKGVARPWHVGLLYGEEQRRLADILFALIAEDRDITVGDNQPYAVNFDNDYTIPIHGVDRGIDNIEFEIRQDLIIGEAGQEDWAGRLEAWLTAALVQLR